MTYAFWIVSGLTAIAAALAVGWPMLRPRRTVDASENLDIRIYRDQLETVEKDVARGVVTAEEAERLRTEIKRRILEADRAQTAAGGSAPRALSAAGAAVAGLAVIAGSFLIYGQVGAPGYEDLPMGKRLAAAERARAERPDQAGLEARMPPAPAPEVGEEYAALIEKLRAAVKENPGELEGWVLLARNEAGLGNLAAAHAAQAEVIALKGEDATSQDYLTLAAIMIQAAGGTVSAEADAALASALELDPQNPIARYYMGLAYLQTDRPDRTFDLWEPLLRESTPDAPWVPVIRARLESVAAMAGIRYTLPPEATAPPPAFGPSAEDMAAAAEMSPEDRQEMIRNMVDGLADRLAEEGGPPEDWARLLNALGVLGETDRAAAIWAEAQQVFAGSDGLAAIRQGAVAAGVAEPLAQGAGGGVAAPGAPASDAPGPSAEDMAAAAEMSPEDRQEMIRNMVEGLGARLAEEGGPPEDWARLLNALGVLGETDRAAAIWAEAQQVFAGSAGLETIRQGALAAGVAEPQAPDAGAGGGDGAAAAIPGSMEEAIAALTARLAREGGTPDDWAMLLRSLGVMGERERAEAVWAEAQTRFDDPAQLDIVRQAAADAGVAE